MSSSVSINSHRMIVLFDHSVACLGKLGHPREFNLVLFVPQLPEETYSSRSVSRVVIVRKRKDFSDALILDKTP